MDFVDTLSPVFIVNYLRPDYHLSVTNADYSFRSIGDKRQLATVTLDTWFSPKATYGQFVQQDQQTLYSDGFYGDSPQYGIYTGVDSIG